MILTGNVVLCQIQWESSVFTPGKQLKDQTAFNKSDSWARPQEGPSFLLFLHLRGASSFFLSEEGTVQKGEGWDRSPADLHSGRTGFCR